MEGGAIRWREEFKELVSWKHMLKAYRLVVKTYCDVNKFICNVSHRGSKL